METVQSHYGNLIIKFCKRRIWVDSVL
uniref:Uncharacterized protein n=1 Tax=Anguilla anguilla TaxID=7936 RepID=A0A0E9QAK3_ANGAN